MGVTSEHPETIVFPPVELALDDPDGLLATGGNLLPETLVSAYSQGIFPWYSDDQPIMWWSPNPRAVVYPDKFRPSRSLRKTLRHCGWRVTLNHCFEEVIRACADSPRKSYNESADTWITEDMIAAYCELNLKGHAHSIEVWSADNNLIGGLYGVACGACFSGESMFHRQTDASKVAFTALCHHAQQNEFRLIDCQVANPHLTSLGALSIPRDEYIKTLGLKPSIPAEMQRWDRLALTLATDYAGVFL